MPGRWDRHPAAQAQTEETAKHIPEEPISSQLVMLGRHTVPHVFIDAKGDAWLRLTGRGVTLDVTMSPAQLRSVAGQAERVLLAHDLRDAS